MSQEIPDITVRGVRTSIPPGYVLGRTSQGSGRLELIPISSLGRTLANSGTVAPPASPVSYLGFYLKGPLRANTKYYGALSHLNMRFPSAIVASVAKCKTVATANTSLSLVIDGSSTMATITFAAGNATGTVAWAGTFTLTSETLPYLLAPNIPDLTFGDVSLLFAGDLI